MFARRPRVLILDDQEWSGRALDSILTPEGYSVDRAHATATALDRVRVAAPDLIVVSAMLPGDPIRFCGTLRSEPAVGHSVPILMTSPDPLDRRTQLRALRAGVWDFVTHPIRVEQLIPKIHNFVRAKLETDDVRAQSLIDETTGFYNRQGLEQRAGEIGSQARRERWGLACVVIAADTGPGNSTAREELLLQAGQRLSELLRHHHRGSDAVGRLGPSEFAIVAPNTSREGIVKLVERFEAALSGADGIRLRAGYDAVENWEDEPVSAHDLVERASKALRGAAPGERWIRPFRTSPDYRSQS